MVTSERSAPAGPAHRTLRLPQTGHQVLWIVLNRSESRPGRPASGGAFSPPQGLFGTQPRGRLAPASGGLDQAVQKTLPNPALADSTISAVSEIVRDVSINRCFLSR